MLEEDEAESEVEEVEEPYAIPQQIQLGKTLINYVPGDQMKGPDQIYYRKKDGSYNLRQFSDCHPSTITMVAYFRGQIYNFHHMCHLLPVARWKGQESEHPPGTIISTRAPPILVKKAKRNPDDPPGKRGKPEAVGPPAIIGRPGGWFMNSTFVDVLVADNDGKTVSTKLTKTKIQMSGPKSEAMGRECVDHLIREIRSAGRFYRWYKAEPELLRAAIDWIETACSGWPTTSYRPVEEWEGPGVLYDLQPDLFYKPRKLGAPPPKLEEMVEEITSRTLNLDYISELRLRCAYWLEIDQKPASTKIGLLKLTRSLAKFSHKLGHPVDREYVAAQLCKRGFVAEFVNTEQTYVNIQVETGIKTTDQTVTRRKKDSGNFQSLNLYAKGTLAHNGPGGAAMEDCYIRVLTALIYIFDKAERRKAGG